MAYSAGYKKTLFDFKKLSMVILSPIPLDATEGLSLQDSFIAREKLNPGLVTQKTGLGGEALLSENLDSVFTLTLTYLPSAEILQKLDILKKLKTQFGIFISNNSAPFYKGVASECRFIEVPNWTIGTSGFSDLPYKIIMTDFIDVFTK